MKIFDYVDRPAQLLTAEIVGQLSVIKQFQGRQGLFLDVNKDELKTLMEVALIQSTGASNRIEGIGTSDKRLVELVQQKSEPHNRSEQEIAGYREALALIHESHEYMGITPGVIRQLHRVLYSFSGAGGEWKNSDNVIAETDARGNQKARFIPVPAYQTGQSMEDLCTAFNEAWNAGRYDRLLLSSMFILDFLCIHPFNDGNGRMSRLLTLLLLYKAGYVVGRYISIEMLIEHSKDTYYDALQASSYGWHENTNTYSHFTAYILGVVTKAYDEFESRVSYLRGKRQGNRERMMELFSQRPGKLSKKDVYEFCPDMSLSTIERILASLVKEGWLVKVGNGRSTAYHHPV